MKAKLSPLPGEPTEEPHSTGRLPNLKAGDVLRTVTNKDLQALLGPKGKYPCSLDFSPPHFALETDQFLTTCRDVVKDLWLSNNPLREIASVGHLSKLKTLSAANCKLQSVNLGGLESLEYLNLSNNQLTAVPKLRALSKLVLLDLSGNALSAGFEELETLRALQVLDLSNAGLDMNIQQFYQYVLNPLKKLAKLAHVCFENNPIDKSIPKLRLLLVLELPKLKTVNWVAVGKDERAEAAKHEHLWKDKTLPATPLKARELVKRQSVASSMRSDAPPSSVLGPGDRDLVNFLLGDETATATKDDPLDAILADLAKSAPSGGNTAGKHTVRASAQLDDFLNTGDPNADPLNDIITYLEATGEAPQSAAPAATVGDYEEELMRVIYGPSGATPAKQQPQQQQQQQPMERTADQDVFDQITADLDAALPSAQQQRSAPVVAQVAPRAPAKSTAVADSDLDDILDSIISSEQDKKTRTLRGAKSAAIDELLMQEEEARLRRLDEEKARVAQERDRQERERVRQEEEARKEREREEARVRAEAAVRQQREADAARARAIEAQKEQQLAAKKQSAAAVPARSKPMTMEEEALALLDSLTNDTPVPNTASAATPPPAGGDDADALLASIDELVGAPRKPASAAASPSPVAKASPVAARPAVLPSGSLPFRRRVAVDDEDDDVAALLAASSGDASRKSAAAAATTPAWVAFWAQIALGDRLGLGTLGATHLGWCRSSEVTVKKLKLQRFADSFLHDFQAEVPALMQLSHPNLVRFLGVCVDDTLAYMMGYVRGCSLWGYLRNTGNLVDLPFVTKTSRAVAAAMFYLHSKGIIHRNLHSKNIILDGEMIPRVRDYGMLFIKNATYELTAGPVHSEAPELLTRSTYTNAVDAYAFGILLWELWTRQDPYRGLSPIAVKEQVLANELRPDVTPDIPMVFRRLMGACWNTDPSRRPPFLTIGKILSKPPEELGAYGTANAPPPSQPVLQGPAAAAAPKAAQPDLVATLDVPEAVDNTSDLVGRMGKLLSSPDHSVQLRGLRITMTLCEKPEFASYLPALASVMPHVVSCMKPSVVDKQARDLAVQTCAKLVATPECADAFLRCGGWPVLGSVIGSGDAALQLSGSMCMTVLLKHPANRDALDAERVQWLLTLLQSDNEGVRMKAVWAASLALESASAQSVFVELGGVPLLLRLAQSPSPGIVLRVLVAVGLLLTNPDVYHDLKDSGVIQRFVKLLASPSPLLQQHGVEALCRFSEYPELRVLMIRNKALDAMLEVMAAPATENATKLMLVSAFVNFLDTETDAQAVEQVQALRPVVRLMVCNDPELRLEALRLISKAATFAPLRAALKSLGALAPLVQLLNSQDKQLRTAALYTMCIASEQEEVSLAFVEADAVAQLMRVCQAFANDRDALELATETLGNFARSEAGIASLRDDGAFRFLVKLINPVTSSAADGAITALVYASASEEGRITVAALDGVAPLLKLALDRSDPDRLEKILWSCPNWCMGSTADVVMQVALPALAQGLLDSKEAIQSVCLKTLLILASDSRHRAGLASAGIARALATLIKTTENPTLRAAAQKAQAMMQE